MNWDAIGAIGQLLGATALFFVLIQVRQARRDAQRSLSQGRGQAFRDLLERDKRMSPLLAKANAALGAQPCPRRFVT